MTETCQAAWHGTVSAYRRARCRCPEVVATIQQYRAVENARNRARRRGQYVPRPQSRDPHVDEIAVERAMAGDEVALTIRERAVAVQRLSQLGLSSRQIADRLRLSDRTVQRYRARAA